MYSRSYGLIEGAEKNNSPFAIPPDYHGNRYRKEEPMRTEIKEEKPQPSSPPQEEKPPPSGIGSGFLEKLTAEDILLFVFLYSLLRGEDDDSGSILGLILALLLL